MKVRIRIPPVDAIERFQCNHEPAPGSHCARNRPLTETPNHVHVASLCRRNATPLTRTMSTFLRMLLIVIGTVLAIVNPVRADMFEPSLAVYSHAPKLYTHQRMY
jgi:hypothetical protein